MLFAIRLEIRASEGRIANDDLVIAGLSTNTNTLSVTTECIQKN